MTRLTSPPLIVYIEDDALSRTMMEFLLTHVMKLNNIIIYENSYNFMDRIRQLSQIPDVFLLDIQIGPHDGYEMLRLLRSDDQYKDALVIALTANVMATQVQQLRLAGFNGLIAKPIDRREFPDLLAKVLAREPVWHVAS